jgi:hypothetical protein
MRKFHVLLCVLAVISSGSLRAQVFGGTPPSVHWKVIESLPAHIIYPPGLDSEAQQVAFLVTGLSHTTLVTIGNKQKPIDIVFHNLTTVSNGYVQLAPFRSEFELTPSQNSFELGSLPWNQMLAIHEYRHVQQYNNFCVGLSKVFFILAGQDGLAFANNLAVPNWFWEGDAVFQETLVSQQGRGRLPLFLTGYESLWISDKKYSWMKLRNGSYRDYTPDHYPLGYMMVSYGREKYGEEFWAKTAVQAAAYKGLFYPLQSAIRRNAGISFDSFHTRALDYFQDQLPQSAYTSAPALYGKKMKHFVADEIFPQYSDSNAYVFLNSSYTVPPAFVMQKTGNEKLTRIAYQAVAIEDAFSYRNHLIAYTAYEPDLRWGWQDYSVIRLLNTETKKDIRLTSQTKYFAPDISPDGQQLVAVNLSIEGKSSLDLLDIHSGKIIRRLPNPERLIYTYPKFYGKDQLLAAVRNKKGQMALLQIDLKGGDEQILTGWSMDPVGFVSVDKEDIYFTRTYQGQDQGFCLHQGRVFLLKADAVTGNYQLSAKNGQLLWTSFTSSGYRIQSASLENIFSGEPVRFPSLDTTEKHQIYALDNPPFQIPSPVPDSGFLSKPYPEFTHIFNFHSWRPYFSDPDYTLSLLGQNVLNTFQSEIYIGYNSDEEYKKTGLDFTYGGLFPVFNIGAEYRIDRNTYYQGQKIYFNELLPYAGVSVPLNFSRGRWLTSLEAGSNISYHQQYFQGIYQDSFKNTSFLSLDPQLFFSHQLQAARMQIYPSFAQTLTVAYDQAISNLAGNQFFASANLFFPGLVSTHSLVLNLSIQQHDSLNQVSFSNNFPFAHGYTAPNFYQMYGLAVNYNFPLVYPDWGFANLIYFLRIRANVFYDYTGVPYYATNGPGVQTQYRSTGIEIYLDTQWWNQLPLSFGIRYSRLLDPDYGGRSPNQWELILPLNILDKGYSNRLANP